MTDTDNGYLARRLDRPMTRPAGIAYWVDDVPPPAPLFGLALQQVAIQSVFFVIPAVLAGTLSQDPDDAVRFLSLSILATVLWQTLMILTKGPVGAGYPLPATQSAATLGAYVLIAQAGNGFGAAGAMLVLTGIAAVGLTFLLQRVRVVLPNEVSGVVVILIGLTLLVLSAQRLGLTGAELADPRAVWVALASLAAMTAVALSRTKAAPFAVLIGALIGIAIAVASGLVRPDAAEQLAGRPWFALPQPWMPRFDQVTPAPMLAMLAALLALKAAGVGTLVVMQRSLDAKWSRPDAPPLRRGLLANAFGIFGAGVMGGGCPNPGSPAMSLSIATGTLSRRIVALGSVLLVVIALCPKLVVLFVLVPEPVKSAMLFYVAGLLLAQGCQLVTLRLLDTRRTLIVAFGLGAGVLAIVAPRQFLAGLPALSSPISIGAVVAFVVNLITLPLVARRSTLEVDLGQPIGRRVSDWLAGVAGGWALKPLTARVADQSVGELMELLQDRGVGKAAIAARLAEDRVEFTLTWTGAPLPERPTSVNVDDLMGDDDTRQGFALWLATRQAQGYRARQSGDQHEAWVAFED